MAKKDYSNYSLEELYRVTQDIDRNSNPEAYAAAVEEIVRKQKQRDAQAGHTVPSSTAEPEPLSIPTGTGGALAGGAGAVVWMIVSPQTTPLASLHAEPIVIQVGMVLIGLCVGALVGACLGVFTRGE